LSIAKGIAKLCDEKCVLDSQTVKTQQLQKQSNIKTLAEAKNWTRDLLHLKRIRYHGTTTESTENIVCSQAI